MPYVQLQLASFGATQKLIQENEDLKSRVSVLEGLVQQLMSNAP